MAKKPATQSSKEFQLKLIPPAQLDTMSQAAVDQWLYTQVKFALHQAALTLADLGKVEMSFPEAPWYRDARRFDTAPKAADGILRRKLWLSLAIEATDEKTKLKCKQHSFIPELIYDKPKKSVCYPDLSEAGKYDDCNGKFKVEQDLHVDNTKTCVSGSLFLPGKQTDVQTLAFFSRYFPALGELLPEETRLYTISHWNETVFDDIQFAIKKQITLDSVMLVNRWDAATGKFLEAELAFKVETELGEAWDCNQLQLASRCYQAIFDTGVFRPAPPIFFYFDPVASVEICDLCPSTQH